MQIVIDVPDKVYEMVMNTGTYGCYRFNSTAAIRKGVPLDKIRAEVEEHAKINYALNVDRANALCWCLDVIDKYKAESEGI